MTASPCGTLPEAFKEILCLIAIRERQPDVEHEVGLVIDWYNPHRPRETLGGKALNAVYY